MISIIVPIYKVEKYIKRCVNSLLDQTLSDFELILVDDGSPDQCGIICDEYMKADSRIIAIHKKNGGLSDARNTGMRIAKGDYIVFVDSDDWVAPTFLEKLYNGIQGNDICECEIIRTSSDKNKDYIENAKDDIKVFSGEEALKMLILESNFHQYVWNKMYKRELIKDILFPIGKINEDEFWTYQAFGKATNVSKISNPLYFYYQRSDSIMGRGYNLKRLDALEAKSDRQKYIEQYYPSLKSTGNINLYYSCIYAGQMVLKYMTESDKKRAIDLINMYWSKTSISRDDKKRFNMKELCWFYIMKCDFWLGCRLRNLLKKGL